MKEEATNAAAAKTPIVRASPQQGFRIQSADAANVANTWTLRRVRPMFEGTLNDIYDFRFTPDFGGWTQAQTVHFADGGVFDQIYAPE